MGLIGKLEDVQFRDLLTLVAARRMSGELSIRNEGEGGSILFRGGLIVAAGSSRDPQSLGSYLIADGHISERDLHEALEVQRQGLIVGRLAQVIESKGGASREVLEATVRHKVRNVIDDLLTWRRGYFQFEPMRVADRGEIVIDPADFVQVPRDLEAAGPNGLPGGGPEGAAEPEPGSDPDETAPLFTEELLLLETPGPSVSGEATAAILAAGRHEVGRGILLVVRYGAFCEMTTVGGAAGGAGEPLRVPRQEASILRDASEMGTQICGALEPGEWNQRLVERLGGGWPGETLVIPAVVAGRTILVFYGDSQPEKGGLGPTPRLERAMAKAVAEMETQLSRRRQRRKDDPFGPAELSALAGPQEPESLAALSRKVDRLIVQNESLLREYRLREQSFWHLAHHDPLTSLPNRFLFRELLAKELAHARQEGDLLAVAIFNVDHFKDVNDHVGEAFGDELLTEVATRIAKIVRAEDTLARLGGDEFALVIPKCVHADNAMLVVRRVFDAFYEPFRVRQNQILLSLSMGVSFYPEDGRSISELVLNAEAALRRAKEAGRNNFQVFAPTMNEWAQVRMELAQDLRRAIARNDELSLLYQPVVSLEDGHIVGEEALLRWHPPERQPIEANTLIELAEDTGQMPALGEWVLRRACARCASWQRAGNHAPVWVNVSVRQFQSGGLVEAVTRALHESGIAPELLRIEVTESIAALNVPQVRETLDRLDKLGVAVVLDDFGSGYSSLSYLMRFSVTGLKIDRSFIAGVPETAEARAVVEASIGIGKSLGLDVVAEGVETEAQLAYLREQGCPYAQGRLLSEPLKPEAFVELFRAGPIVIVGTEPRPAAPTTP